MLLLYVDYSLFFANTLEDVQTLVKTLIFFYMRTKLSVNNSKTTIILVKSQEKDKPCIMNNNEPLDCVENLKYVSLEVHSNHR